MEEYKEQAIYMFNNFELKRWLHGNQNRRRQLLVKLKHDLRKLGLSRRATRAGLVQLAIKPCVILKRLSVSCCKKKLVQSSHNINQNFIPFHKEESQSKFQDDVEKKRLEDNSQDIVQQSDSQIPNAAVGTDVFAKISVIKASSSSLEDKSLKKHIQNIVHESENESSDITLPIQLKKHHCDSKSSINPLKDNIFEREHKEKKESKIGIMQEFFSKNELLDISQEDFYDFKTDNIFPESIISSSNVTTSELKTYSKIINNFTDETQDVPEKSEQLIEHIDTLLHQTPIKKDINQAKIYLESKNSQIKSQLIETNSKTIKRKIQSENLENIENISLIKIRKEDEENMPSEKIVADSNIKTSHYEMLSDDELVHTTNERNWESTKCMIREKENIKLQKQIRKRHRKEKNNKIKKIRLKRERLQEYFRGNFDPDTSESEEDREILLNYLKKNKQQFNDPLHNNITKKEVKYIFKRHKLTRNLSANNWQKDMESMIPDKIKSDNLYDSTISVIKYALPDATDKEIKDRASLDKCTLTNLQYRKSIENINSDNSCDSTVCTIDTMYDVTTEEEVEDGCKRSTSVNESQKDTGNIYSDISCDSDTCTEKYYSMHSETTDEEVEEEEALIYERGTSDDNSQENVKKNIKDAISTKAKSKNSNNSSTCKEKYHATIEKDIKDAAYICDTSINNSPENIDVLSEVKFDNSSDSSECTEKYCAINDAATKKEMKNKALICTNDTLTNTNNSQENIENAIPGKSDNSWNSTARTEKCDITTKKKINDDESIDDESICMLSDNSQKNTESAISFEAISDNSCNSTVNIGKYAMHDTITDEKKEGGASVYKLITSKNSQEHIKSAIPAEVNSDNLCDSISNIEKHSTHNIITDEKTEDGASICKRDTSANESPENVISAKEQNIQNSLSITEDGSKSDCTEHNIILSTIEINLDENMSIENIYFNKNIKKKADITYVEAKKVSVQTALQNLQENQEMRNVESIDLAQRKNMQKNATSNLELLITSAHESTSYNVGKKNDCDILEKNVENLLLPRNDNIAKETIDQLSVTASKLKKNSLEEKSNNSLSILPSISSVLSKLNYSDNHSLDSHSADDDNSSDIEVEIKIRSKLKSRVSRKFSLKAPWSAVNTCIKNLHTLKDNPSFLNDLFQIDHKISEKSDRKITNMRDKEDSTSLDDNVTTETDKIIFDSSPTIKDNANHSQQQNCQDCPILNKDRNIMDYNQKEKDEHTQSIIQTTQIITENNLESSRLTCDTLDLEKQIAKDDKQKTNKEQNSRDNTILEGTKNVAEHNQDKEAENILSVERKKTQITIENSLESVKAVYNTSDVAEQQTSSDRTHRKVRVRSIAELSCQSVVKSVNLNASIPKNVCSAFCQSVPFHSTSQSASQSSAAFHLTSPQSASFQSAPSQSAPSQSAPSQSIPSQSALSQSTCPQLGRSPRFTSPQSTSSQSVSKRPPPSYDANFKHTYLSPNTSSLVAPIEINTPSNNDFAHLIQITIRNICSNVEYCRELVQYKLLRIYAPEDYVQRMITSIRQIEKDLEKLKIWLHTENIENTLIFINLHMSKKPVTISEIMSYIKYVYTYYNRYTLQQNNNVKSNASQYPNINGMLAVPNASMPNVNEQQFLGNIPFPDARNRSTFMQSSTMPCPAPTTSNINQQQLARNSANSIQVPHSKQPTSNIRQQYMSYVPPTAHPYIPNSNQQQSLENASHSIQSQYDGRHKPADMLNIQQGFANMTNISSNANMRSHGPVNQGNANAPPTTSMRQLYTALQQNIISSTTTVSATNAQQKQTYFQTSQINSRTTVYPHQSPMTNQNIPLGICQTVPGCDNVNLPGSFTINPNTSRTNAAKRNIRHRNANMNQQQISCCPQVSRTSSGKTQSSPQYALNSNKMYYPFVPQPEHCNMQTHPVQNTLPDQNVWQIPRQQLPINQGNTSMSPTTNTKQSHIASKNTSSNTTAKSQHVIMSQDTSTCPIDLSINDISQNVQQNVLQQKFKSKGIPVNQGIANMSPAINARQSHITSKNPISSTTTAKSHHVILFENSSIYPINQSINDISQNVQQNVLYKEVEMPESQDTNRMQKKAQFMNPQRHACQEKKEKSIIERLQTNKVVLSNFNLAILTDIQKIVLRDQIKSYFTMPDEHQNLLNKQEFERVNNERIILFYLYWNLDNYIMSMINELETVKKTIEQSSQENTSQNKSVLQENTIQTSVDKLTKTQSNRDNENNLECNRILEKQSERSIGPNILKNSMAIRTNLEVSNEETLFMPKSVIINESLPKDIRLQEQVNTLKKSQKSSSDTGKGLQSTETSSSEDKSIAEVSAKNLKMAQDNVKNNEHLKSVLEENTIQSSVDKLTKTQSNRDNENSLECNRILEKQSERSIGSNILKNSKSMAIRTNLEVSNEETLFMPKSVIINESLPKDIRLQEQVNTLKKSQKSSSDTGKGLQSTETSSSEDKSVAEVSAKNLKTTQDNVKNNEHLKAASLHDSLLAKCLPNLLQETSTEKTKDQSEITKNNANKRFINVETESVHKTSNVAILNNSEQNNTISRALCNTEEQNKEVYNTNNEISNKNLQDGTCDNIRENNKILNSTKIQSDPLNILHVSESSSLNNEWESTSPRKCLQKKCESIEISESHIAYEEDAKTISKLCLNIQLEDSTNEGSNDSIETSESFGKLYIDENAETQNQCDKISSEEDNLSVLQDSVELSDTIRCDSTKRTSLSPLKNTAKAVLSDQDFKTETQDIEKLNERQSLEVEKMQLQVVSLKFEDEWSMRENVIQSIDTIKKHEDVKKENNEQSLLTVEELEFQKMLLRFETSEDTLCVKESTIESIYLKHPKNVEEKKMEINTQKLPEDIEEEKMEVVVHNDIKVINENSEQLLLKAEEVEFQKMSLRFEASEDTLCVEESMIESICLKHPKNVEEKKMEINTQKLPEDIEEEKMEVVVHNDIKVINENSEQLLLKAEEVEFQKMSLRFEASEDTLCVEESMIESICLKHLEDVEEKKMEINTQKLPEDIEEEKMEIDTHSDIKVINENNEQSLLKAKEIEFQKMSLKFEASEDTLCVEENMIESICLKHLEDVEEKKMKINTQKLPEDIEEVKMEIDTHSDIKVINENNEQSLLKTEEIIIQEISSKFGDPEDISSIESTDLIYLDFPEDTEEETIKIDTQKLPENIEKKKIETDTHSGIKAINEQLKHVSEQKYGKSRTRALNSLQKDDSLDVNVKETFAKNDFFIDDAEYISVKSDDSDNIPNILNIRSISPSLFEKMENIDAFLENNSESLNKNDEKSMDINDNLGIPDEIDNRPCLRCKRKSMVYCQACLEAHYCSRRCSTLHWNAEHYKQCKGYNSIICIDE